MQDEINEKVIALSIRTTKLTAEMLQKSIRFMLLQIKKQLDKPVQHHGKQTLKQLMKQNAGVSSIEITDSNIKAFESTAKKYGVDFALKKDATESPPRYLVFFKGRDADVLTAAFQEFSARKLTREQIFRLVYHAAGCDKPFSRLWISSMEKSAIKKGFAELKPGEAYDALYASALCRAKADWIIGINATRLFSVLHGKTLNVGRVQTPTLKMLADRDAAITSFKKETYHIVRLDVGGAEAASARISDAAKAEAVKMACEASQAVCVSVRRERKTEQPPRLFDLTGLQREANRIYGYTAKQTLDLAQALYEKRLLTYPRTDSNG